MENKEPAQEGMLSNNAHDLFQQLKKENQSYWRIKNNCKKDLANDKEVLDFWNFHEKDKQEYIKKLTGLLEKLLKTR